MAAHRTPTPWAAHSAPGRPDPPPHPSAATVPAHIEPTPVEPTPVEPTPVEGTPVEAARVEAPPIVVVAAPSHPRRLATTLCFLLIVAGMLVTGRYLGSDATHRTAVPATAAASAPAGVGAATTGPRTSTATAGRPPGAAPGAGTDTADTAPPMAGTSGRFAYAGGFGPVLGAAGAVRRFRVAVEKPAPVGAVAAFADQVNRILGDPRSWIAGRRFRLQRVPASAYAEFTIYLASAATSQRMCYAGHLRTAGYTSCRLPGQVILNDRRWETAVPGYGAPLAVYQAYAINHEVGHQLGHGHEACPGKGRPAPVMMQQTYGLQGCVANSWPFLGGKRYAGRPVP